MKIKEALKYFNIISNDNRNARYLVNNSKLMKKYAIFIAIDKGVNYIAKLNPKPLIIISNKKVDGVFYIPNLKEEIGAFCNYFYNIKKDRPHLIGIVGTNGKTSVATILHHLLPKSSLVTTIKNIKDSYLSVNTTPDAVELANDIVKARKRKYHFLILEVSSIGIKENRVKGFEFDYLIFTNLTEDHLDYHHSLKDYQDTKMNFLRESKAILVANNDDKFGKDLVKTRYLTMGYELDEHVILKESLKGTKFYFDNNIYETQLIGRFNVENLLAVLTLLKILGKTVNEKALKNMPPIRGRMDVVNANPCVIIDYAHTIEALKESLQVTKKLTKNRLVLILGAGGERDKSKRKEYGKLALTYGDKIYLTNDNPRHEDEMAIINDIMDGNNDKFIVILKRSLAIQKALKDLNEGDILLILGKGHEDYQIINDDKLHYSDYEEVNKWLMS